MISSTLKLCAKSKSVIGTCLLLLALQGCGVYAMQKNNEALKALTKGTPKENIGNQLSPPINFATCDPIGIIDESVIEDCSYKLTLNMYNQFSDNHIFFHKGRLVGSGRTNIFMHEYAYDLKKRTTDRSIKSLIMINRMTPPTTIVDHFTTGVPRSSLQQIDVYANGSIVGKLKHEGSILFEQNQDKIKLDFYISGKLIKSVNLYLNSSETYVIDYSPFSTGAFEIRGDNPIFKSISEDSFDKFKGNVASGVNINGVNSTNGLTPLIESIINNKTEFARLLIEKGAAVDTKTPAGDTALLLAAFKGNAEIAKLLIDKGASLDVQNPDGSTALILTASNGNTEIARLLIEKGASLGNKTAVGNTALIVAVDKSNAEIAQMLIDKGVSLDVQNKYGNTALILAVDKGYTEIARLLIVKGASLDVQNQNGSRALTLAADKSNTEIARLLIEKGASLDNKTAAGDTALILAAFKGNAEIAKLLIEKGANLDVQNKFGDTALILATDKKNLQLVVELIKHAANPAIANQAGRSAGSIAKDKGFQEIATILDSAMQSYIAGGRNSEDSSGQQPEISRKELRKVSSGTAFRINPKGVYVTNNHVVDRCKSIRIDGSELKLINTDSENDLALVRGQEGVAAHLRAGKDVRVGDTVIAVGYPLNSILGKGLQATSGEVSGLSGLRNDLRFLHISTPVNSGNSGGPLLDTSGNVVGVVTAKLNGLNHAKLTGNLPENVNFAVKANILKSFLELNGIEIEEAESKSKIETPDVVDKARKYTVLVECWE